MKNILSEMERRDHSETGGEIIIYQPDEQSVRFEVRIEDETVWLTQKQMAQLFDCSADNISLHLKNIYNEKELIEKATAEEFSVVQIEGKEG